MNDSNLRNEDTDRLAKALLTLAKELWIVKDRQRVLEAALAEAGIPVAGALDKYQPGPELQQQLDDDRHALIEQLLKALEGK
jgi:hypothetical protein